MNVLRKEIELSCHIVTESLNETWYMIFKSIIGSDWITFRDINSSEEWNIMLENIRDKYWIIAVDSNTDLEWIK